MLKPSTRTRADQNEANAISDFSKVVHETDSGTHATETFTVVVHAWYVVDDDGNSRMWSVAKLNDVTGTGHNRVRANAASGNPGTTVESALRKLLDLLARAASRGLPKPKYSIPQDDWISYHVGFVRRSLMH